MTPGPADEVGKVATTFMDIMRQQPMALALVVMNFTLLAFVFWNNHELTRTRELTGQHIMQWQTDVNKLLANCVPMHDMEEMLRNLKQQ